MTVNIGDKKLTAPIRESLDSPNVFTYRQMYRNYRLGYHEGAKGECPPGLDSSGEKNSMNYENNSMMIIDNINNNREQLSIIEGEVLAGEKDREAISILNRWRLSYRSFRQGKARGAEGEILAISCKLSKHDVSLLPVGQLMELRRARVATTTWATTAIFPTAAAEEEQLTEETRKKTRPPILHVHFGAGKLGLGLVVLALSEGPCPFILLQNRSSFWDPIFSNVAGNHDSITLEVRSGGDSIRQVNLFIHRPTDSLDQLKQKMTQHKGGFVFVDTNENSKISGGVDNFTTNPSEIWIYNVADSFSCAIGTEGLESVLVSAFRRRASAIGTADFNGGLITKKTPATTKIKLFACENDHAAVHRLAENKLISDQQIEVVPCMVDRICASRELEVNENKNVCKLIVQAEPYFGEIVVSPSFGEMPRDVYGDKKERICCPMKGTNVHEPELDAQCRYLTQRKLLLVNGTHTTLAFLTLIEHKGDSNFRRGQPNDFEMLTNLSPQQHRLVWIWAVARCLMILWENDIKILKETHGRKILETHASQSHVSQSHGSEEQQSLVDEKVQRNGNDDYDDGRDDVSDESQRNICKELLEYASNALNRFRTIKDSTKRVLGGGIDNRYETRLSNVRHFVDENFAFFTAPICRELLKQADIGLCELGCAVFSLIKDAEKYVLLDNPTSSSSSSSLSL